MHSHSRTTIKNSRQYTQYVLQYALCDMLIPDTAYGCPSVSMYPFRNSSTTQVPLVAILKLRLFVS